jgi:hypothetical protein
MKETFLKQGFAKLPSFIDSEEVARIGLIYDERILKAHLTCGVT